MHDQSFNQKTLSQVFKKIDFVGIQNSAQMNEFRENVLKKALASAASGFSIAANPLVSFPLHRRQVFMFHSLSDELVARKLCSNIKKTSKVSLRGRAQIVSNLRLLLEEGVPFRVYRLDVKSFYESFNFSQVIAKVDQLADLSPQSKRLLHDLLSCHLAIGGTGIPRGLALSAVLSEYLMRDFDHKVREHAEVFFSSRYVDDIIIVTSAREDAAKFVQQIQNMLPTGLRLNSTKKQINAADIQVSPIKPNDANVQLFKFDYLGYSFHISEPVREKNKQSSDHFRKVVVDIAEKKINRFKTRISRSFYDFAKSGDWWLLRDRVKFLTKNFSVYNAKAGGKKIAGIFYSYPLASSEAEGIASLDRFLRNAVLSKKGRIASLSSSKLTGAQKRQLLSNSFTVGHAEASFVYFSGSRLKQIQKCWKN